MKKFSSMDGSLRIYDGTGTPFFLDFIFEDSFGGPLGIPSTEEILVLNRGRADANMHYIQGSDDKILEPLEITFNVIAEDSSAFTYFLDWLEGNTVNSNTIVTTKGTTQRVSGHNNPAFADSGKKTCNVEYMLDGANDIAWKYAEVWFDMSKLTFSESAEGISISVPGTWYGTITRGTAFTAGTDVTA